MRTLFLRVRRVSETALVIARRFHGHPALTAVLYPGLPSHPGHAIAAPPRDVARLRRIELLLRAAVPEVTDVRVVWPNGERAAGTDPDEGIDRLRRVLDDKVNPAVAAHRGRVVVVDLIDRRASIRLEGGCQGCSLAEVTVRQGIERLVRAHCPEVIAVIDVTDHSAGTEPFYTPDKR
jgi:Fe-S cluster biogenesis protein NfuA